MKKIFYLSTMFAVIFLIACEKIADPIDETGKITAKEYVDDVLQKARLDFATMQNFLQYMVGMLICSVK